MRRREISYGDFCRCDDCNAPDEDAAELPEPLDSDELVERDDPSPSTTLNEMEASMSDPETEYEFRRSRKRNMADPAYEPTDEELQQLANDAFSNRGKPP